VGEGNEVGVAVCVGAGVRARVGVVTDAGAKLMTDGFVTASTLYTHQPVGKVKALTTCPEGLTSTKFAPVSLKPHDPSGSMFCAYWCVGDAKSPIKSPFGRCTIEPPARPQMDLGACQLQTTFAVMAVSFSAISIRLLRQSSGLVLFS